MLQLFNGNKDVLSLDSPVLTLFSSASEPVLVARFICLAAIPRIIVGHKTSHGWRVGGGEDVQMNNFHFFSFIFTQKGVIPEIRCHTCDWFWY